MDNLLLNIINDNELPIPNKYLLTKCLKIVADKHNIKQAEVNIKIVSNNKIQQINKKFRKQNKPTNIISFAFNKPIGLPNNIMNNFLGDIVIAPRILEEEARGQKKNLDNHWHNIFIHGLLHLLGYDHLKDQEADEMESVEIELLSKLGIDNPY